MKLKKHFIDLFSSCHRVEAERNFGIKDKYAQERINKLKISTSSYRLN